MPDTVTMTQDAVSQLHADFASLAHKHASVSFLTLGVLALVLVVAGAGGWLALRSFDAQLTRAQATEAKYEAEHKQLTELLASDAEERRGLQAQQAVLEAQIAKRATQPLPQPIQDGLKPDATAEQAAIALGVAYSLSPIPEVVQGTRIAVSVSNAQDMVKTKVDALRLGADLADTASLYQIEQKKTASLSTDLQTCTNTLDAAQKTINGYKKIVKPTKFKRFLTGAEKVAIFIGGVYLGHKF